VAQFPIIEGTDEVRGAHEEIGVHGRVLAVFEGSESIEDEGLTRSCRGSILLEKEKAVAAEAIGVTTHGGVRDAGLPSDLAKT
jgi:hypothetical protein